MKAFKKHEGYVTKGNRKIQEGKSAEALQIVLDGLDDYQNRIIKAINGYPANDAALVITSLRALADNLQKENPECESLLQWIKNSCSEPKFQNTQRVEKTKHR